MIAVIRLYRMRFRLRAGYFSRDGKVTKTPLGDKKVRTFRALNFSSPSPPTRGLAAEGVTRLAKFAGRQQCTHGGPKCRTFYAEILERPQAGGSIESSCVLRSAPAGADRRRERRIEPVALGFDLVRLRREE